MVMTQLVWTDLKTFWKVDETRIFLHSFNRRHRSGFGFIDANQQFDVSVVFLFLYEPQQIDRLAHNRCFLNVGFGFHLTNHYAADAIRRTVPSEIPNSRAMAR